jgi:hypothetical protein
MRSKSRTLGQPLFDHLVGASKEGGRDRKPSSLAAFKLMRSSDSFNAITLSTATLPQEGDRRKARKSSHPMVAGIKISGAIVPTLYGAKFPSSASRR